jgi:hypothetical protein
MGNDHMATGTKLANEVRELMARLKQCEETLYITFHQDLKEDV